MIESSSTPEAIAYEQLTKIAGFFVKIEGIIILGTFVAICLRTLSIIQISWLAILMPIIFWSFWTIIAFVFAVAMGVVKRVKEEESHQQR